MDSRSSTQISVTHLQRYPREGAHSVERLFEDVRGNLPGDIDVVVRTNRFATKGLLRRLYDSLAVRFIRTDLRHILGDIHYVAWFIKREGTILTVLDCVALERLKGVRRLTLWLLWYWWPVRQAQHITVISDYTKQALLRWVRIPSDKISVIHPPVSDEFKPVPLGSGGTRTHLLVVGTAPNKNLERVIESIAGLHVVLSVVGVLSEHQRALLRNHKVDYENHVNLDREGLLTAYEAADMLVFASTYEGFGMPIVEAQAVGRPVVTSTTCAMPEAAGGAALLVDPEDIASIRAGILRLIEDWEYRDLLVQRGFENARRYDARIIAEQYAFLYRRL